MKPLFPFRLFGRAPGFTSETLPSAASDTASQVLPGLAPAIAVASAIHPIAQAMLQQWHSRSQTPEVNPGDDQSGLLSALGWITAGIGTLALGLVLGRELRRRYKFNRRTPYDFYSHSGDERDLEFGVGI